MPHDWVKLVHVNAYINCLTGIAKQHFQALFTHSHARVNQDHRFSLQHKKSDQMSSFNEWHKLSMLLSCRTRKISGAFHLGPFLDLGKLFSPHVNFLWQVTKNAVLR